MDAKRWFCLVLVTSFLAACGQPATTPTPTPASLPAVGRPYRKLAADSKGRIYVTDAPNHRIVRIDDMSGAGMISFGSRGNGVGQFEEPIGIAVDPADRIYVADCGNNAVVRMDDMNGSNWVAYGGFGDFSCPWGIALDATGRIYLTEYFHDRIVRIDDMAGGNWVTYGSKGWGVGQFDIPLDISVDAAGRIYVLDGRNMRIVRQGLDELCLFAYWAAAARGRPGDVRRRGGEDLCVGLGPPLRGAGGRHERHQLDDFRHEG
jgi:DNA-binding beta-propeller fold protein YncE